MIADRAPSRRLFYALWPSELERARLAAGFAPLVATVAGRPVPPANLHVTLEFLGLVAEPRIATLRALGFGAAPVVCSVLIESLVLALIGGIVGGLGAYLAFDGYGAATMNFQTFSQIAFAFAVTPKLLLNAIILASMIGLLGGLFPAWRAARLPIASALREV